MADDGTLTWRELQREARERFAAAAVPEPEVSARRIVEEASGYEGAELMLGLGERASARGVARFDRMVARRLEGEPLQYVVGRWGFRTLDLMVDARVLIPRPETEDVAGAALAELDRSWVPGQGPQRAADLGTGSGAIALSLAVERDHVEVWATDASADALAVARANLAGAGRPGARVRLAEGSWFEALPPELAGRLDLIVSNPPYIGAGEELPAEVREWEPAGALIAGPTGLEALHTLVDGARAWLAPGGALVLELAPGQAAAVLDAARAQGYTDARALDDSQGRERMVVMRAPG